MVANPGALSEHAGEAEVSLCRDGPLDFSLMNARLHPRWRAVLVGTVLMALSLSSRAEEPWPWLETGGLLFGDVYHNPSHHLPEGDGATGLVLRRGYLTFDADWTDNWFGRMRFELNQDGEFESYDFEVDFKDLYVGYRFGEHVSTFGLHPTLTFDVVEKHWGKRHLMRTPMDLQGEPSRDSGVSVKGPLGSGPLKYRVMLGSGKEFGAESGDGRKLMLALQWQISEHWMADFYVDKEKLSGPTDRETYQAFLAYETDRWRWGVLYSNQDRETDPPLELASTWWVGTLREATDLVLRVDRIIEPSPKGDNISYIPFDSSAPATMLYAGVEFGLNDHVSLTPNLVVTHYDRNDEGIRPETDIYLRLTAFVNFE